MPEYLVKTYDNRNLVIEADSYTVDHYCNAYEFAKDGKKVATIPFNPGIFAIILNDAEKSDHYYVYDWNEEDEDETDDVCIDCRSQELLESDEFVNAVWEVIEAFHAPDEPENAENSLQPPVEEPLTKVERRLWRDEPIWGFTAEGRFIPFFQSKEYAEEQAAHYRKGSWGAYVTRAVEECPLVKGIV